MVGSMRFRKFPRRRPFRPARNGSGSSHSPGALNDNRETVTENLRGRTVEVDASPKSEDQGVKPQIDADKRGCNQETAKWARDLLIANYPTPGRSLQSNNLLILRSLL